MIHTKIGITLVLPLTLMTSACDGWRTQVPSPNTLSVAQGLPSIPEVSARDYCANLRREANTAIEWKEPLGIGAAVLGAIGVGAFTGLVATSPASATGQNGATSPGLTKNQGLEYGGLIAASTGVIAFGIYELAEASSARSAFWLTNSAIASMNGNSGIQTAGLVPGTNPDPYARFGGANLLFRNQQDWQSCAAALTGIAPTDSQVDTSVAGALKPAASGGGGSGSGNVSGRGSGSGMTSNSLVERVDEMEGLKSFNELEEVRKAQVERAACISKCEDSIRVCNENDTQCNRSWIQYDRLVDDSCRKKLHECPQVPEVLKRSPPKAPLSVYEEALWPDRIGHKPFITTLKRATADW